MIPVVILASGRGSNFDAIQSAIEEGRLAAKVCAVISDKVDARVLEKAKRKGIPAIALPILKESGLDRLSAIAEHDERLLQQIWSFDPKFLILAGYKRIISTKLIESFRSDRGYSRIVNIHPSLLPAFPGLNSYQKAFYCGVKVTGVTVHLVEGEVDSGPVCAQEAFYMGDCHSSEQVEKMGLQIEHRLFPKTLSWVLSENFTVYRRRVIGVASNVIEGRLCVCQS